MSKRKTHLSVAKRHGRKAITELRRMTADSALHWVLSHRTRVAQFRRAVEGTTAERPLSDLIALIRHEASSLRKAKPARVARKHRRRAAATRTRMFWPAYGVI